MENIKFKPLSKAQILISLDRLTRFKHPEIKYLRVFKDILASNLILPKFKKSQIDKLDSHLLLSYVELIFNDSISKLGGNNSQELDFSLNKKILSYEKSIFNIDSQVLNLVDNKIDYAGAMKLFTVEELPLNLLWVNSFVNGENPELESAKNGYKFPISKLVLVEGITEEILLPKLAQLIGFDLDRNGVYVLSAGGKNQVVKLFYEFAESLKLPIFVLLDRDGQDNFEEIKPKLRNFDTVHVLQCGEFEDLLPLILIKRTLNRHLKNFSSVKLDELRQDLPMTKILAEIFKQKGFGEFKKAEFAQMVAENLTAEELLPEIVQIVEEIKILSTPA